MKVPFANLAIHVLLIGGPTLASAGVVFDQGPTTGVYSGVGLSNITSQQTFAERVVFDHDTWIDGYNHFTPTNLSDFVGVADFRLRVYTGNIFGPIDMAYQFDLGWSNSEFSGESPVDGAKTWKASFKFAPILFEAGSIYWVGLSGNGVQAGQWTLLPGPGDDRLAQFTSAGTFSGLSEIGDQMFQLTSTVPEIGAAWLFLVGLPLVMLRRSTLCNDA